MGMRSTGKRVNAAVEGLAGRVDDQTGEVARNAAQVITVAVWLLRWPSLALLLAPLPFLVGLVAIGLVADDAWLTVLALALGIGGAAVSAAFALRRHHVWQAVQDEQALATELGVAVAMSDDVDEARDALGQLAGGAGGVRIFSRLRGLWRGFGIGPGVVQDAADLPRARWFFPPKVGTTVTLLFAALWLVPVAFLGCLFLAIALAAR